MTPKLEQKLIVKYPLILAKTQQTANEGDMYFGICCGDGWYNILDSLFWNIQTYITETNKNTVQDTYYNLMREHALVGDYKLFNQYYSGYDIYLLDTFREQLLVSKPKPLVPKVQQIVATQIKEKLGSLRFYYDGFGNERIMGMCYMAESLSSTTCEVCGNPGHVRTNNMSLRARCDAHVNQ